MDKNKTYVKGDTIKSIEELMAQEFIFFRTVLIRKWIFTRWPYKEIKKQLAIGNCYKAKVIWR